MTTLNCMGEKKNISAFCEEKEAANPYYIRAIVNKKTNKVDCLSSKRVLLKYKCETKNDRYCKDKEIGCYLFKEQLAKRLKISHQSLNQNILSCYFDIKQKVLIDN